MRNVTNELAIGAFQATNQFKQLFSTKASAKLLYAISKHEDALLKHATDYDRARIVIVEGLADKDDQGKAIILYLDENENEVDKDAKDENGNLRFKTSKYKMSPDKEFELNAELKDLLALDVEVPDYQISIDELSELKIEPAMWPGASAFMKYYIKD
jgi:hypothetical protein